MDDGVETSAHRVRYHLRRPLAGSRNLMMKTAGNTHPCRYRPGAAAAVATRMWPQKVEVPSIDGETRMQIQVPALLRRARSAWRLRRGSRLVIRGCRQMVGESRYG
jgi:hypothetical protein